MSKDIKIDVEARDGIVKGINTVADVVKTTVGPRGRNVLIRNNISAPIITKTYAVYLRKFNIFISFLFTF